MNIGIYEGATAMGALERWQTAISQNIGSASVPGFKGSDMSVSGVDYGTLQDRTGVRSSTQPAIMPSDSTRVNFLPGSSERTGTPTDFAIGGNGFFATTDSAGKTLYTRNGQFNIDSSNQLVTSNGNVVQGVGGPVSLLPNGEELSVDAGGQIYQGGQLVGRLKVVDFEDKTQLTRAPGGFYASASATEKPINSPNISQGYLEGSNVSTIKEMVNLIQATRAHEANQKVVASYDNRLAKTIQAFTR